MLHHKLGFIKTYQRRDMSAERIPHTAIKMGASSEILASEPHW